MSQKSEMVATFIQAGKTREAAVEEVRRIVAAQESLTDESEQPEPAQEYGGEG